MEELIPIFFFMTVGAVMILRPISKRLGYLLEALAKERQVQRGGDGDLASMRVMLEHVAKRMDLLEERLDFTERLLGERRTTGRARPSEPFSTSMEAELLGR